MSQKTLNERNEPECRQWDKKAAERKLMFVFWCCCCCVCLVNKLSRCKSCLRYIQVRDVGPIRHCIYLESLGWNQNEVNKYFLWPTLNNIDFGPVDTQGVNIQRDIDGRKRNTGGGKQKSEESIPPVVESICIDLRFTAQKGRLEERRRKKKMGKYIISSRQLL